MPKFEKYIYPRPYTIAEQMLMSAYDIDAKKYDTEDITHIINAFYAIRAQRNLEAVEAMED